ncbi:MAG: ShlB/FhaC/HecB family hemolysin secretion/activation protein, partial [Verrucomicrobiota bacterium]
MFTRTPSSRGIGRILLLLALLASVAGIQAQDIERIKPAVSEVEPAPGPAKITLPPEDEEGEISDEKVGEITGIALVGHPDLAKPDTPPSVKGVEVLDEDLLVPDGVIEELDSYIDGPLSLKVVNDIARSTVLAYRKAGLPVVDVAFPEQDVSTGVLQLVVVVAKAGEITLKGNKFFKDDIYLRSFRLEPGDVIKADKVNGDLRYLNRSPYRNVGVVYSPGEEFGQTNLTIETEERRPYSAYVGYDDTGNSLIGIDRMFFGLEWGNVFGLDHQAGYQYTTTTEFEGLHAHAASYRIPFAKTWHELILLAGYVESLAEIPAAGEILETGGQSTQLSAMYSIPLPEIMDYTTDFRAGFDFKSTNNNLEFGGAELIDSTAEVYQFSAGFQAVKRQDFGRQILQTKLVWSPGDLSNHNSDEAVQQLRGLGSADYFYWNGEFTQIVNLPRDFILVAEVEGQVSNGNLLPSETMVLGG